MQCVCKVTVRCVGATVSAIEKQLVLRIFSVCL
jgi:hypothetical protein